MTIQKDDPIYYKIQLNKLINQAKSNGLKVWGEDLRKEVFMYFEAGNGDIAGVGIEKEN
jgi:hypothetical protein